MKTLATLSLLLAMPVLAAGVRTDNLVKPLTSAPSLLIPAAGSAPGASGTYFRSDVTLLNLRDTAQTVKLTWVPQLDSPARSEVTMTLGALSGFQSEDFAANVMHVSGLGSIVITGVTSSGTDDLGARLWATSRIWTPQPDTGGTTSQSFPSVPLSEVFSQVGYIFGLRYDDRYRSNVGIVNLDPVNAQTFQITDPSPLVDPPHIVTMTLPPMTMHLVAMPSFDSQLFQLNVNNVTPAQTRSTRWLAFGSSIDNVTGDAWSELAVTGEP